MELLFNFKLITRAGNEEVIRQTAVVWDFKNRTIRFIPIIGNFAINYQAMNRNTSISLGSYFDNFIQRKIASGRYKNASEIVRAGLRLLEEEENKVIALKAAINEGINSGIASEFEPDMHLSKLKSQKL